MLFPSPSNARPFKRASSVFLFTLACLLCAPRLLAQDFLEPDPRWLYPHFLGFRPADGRAADVNPPRFSWPHRPGIRGNTDEPIRLFHFQVADNSLFNDPVVKVTVDYNFYNRLAPFPPGTWFWRVGYDHNANGTVDEWSDVRSFIVDGAEPAWDRSGHSNAHSALSNTPRPRFGPVDGDWAAFKTFLESTPRGQDWLNQLRTHANRIVGAAGFAGRDWYVNAATHFPPTDEDGGPLDADGAVDGKVSFSTGSGTATWQSNDYGRMAQQLAMVAFAHKVTGDPNYAGAKDLLLNVAAFPHTPDRHSLSWPEFHGATTKQTTAITEYLALIYDWYYDDLTPEQRGLLRDRVALRVQQVFLQGRSWRSADAIYHNGVGIRSGSHHYQNFFWAMPGLLLLAGDNPVSDATMAAETLLPLTIDFLTGVTAGGLYGPDDGAINEGVGYGGEKQGTLLRTALMAEVLLDLDQAKNPFLAGYQKWFSHVLFDGYQRSPFGDQWSYNAAEQVLQNQQALTLLTGNPQAKTRWAAEAAAQGDRLEDHAFSRPWTLMLAYQHKHENAYVTPEPESNNALFPESGWVMAGSEPPTDKTLADTGPRMIFQSRPRGGLSHSYLAENAFSWHAFGEPLAAGGGSRRYPDPYSRHTMSHNSMLIDGQGQNWINPNWPAKPFMGRILAYTEGGLPNGGSYVHWVGDASNAYRTLPGAGLRRWHRHVIFVDQSYFIIYDDLEMNEGAAPARFSWLLHADRPPPANVNVSGNEFGWTQNGVHARVAFSRDTADLEIIHLSGTGAIPDPNYISGSGWAPDIGGDNVFYNPVTGESLLPSVIALFDGTDGSGSFAGSKRYYFSEAEYAEHQRTQNTLWVQNAEPAARWQLMTALLAWPSGDTAPQVDRISNNRMRITYGGIERTLSFDPTQPGDYTVDLNAYRAHAGETIPEKPLITVRRSTACVRENSGDIPYFRLERSENYGLPVTVSFTLTGTAVPGVDYIPSVTESVTLAAEESEAVIYMEILDNPVLEADRTVVLTLHPDPAYDLDQTGAVITIRDDEALSPGAVNESIEPGHTRQVELRLANPHPDARTYTLSGLTAESGYTWNSSNNLTGESLVPAFSWFDLSTSPTATSPNSYSGSAAYGVAMPVQIPIGFEFPFHGKTKTHVTAHINGFLYFGDGSELIDESTGTVNEPLPSHKVPYDAIFPLWSNFRIQASHGGGMFWEQTDANTFIVQWNQVGIMGQGVQHTATFQAVLRCDGSMTFRYKDFDFGGNTILYTVGIQDHENSQALQMSHNAESSAGTFVPKGKEVDFTVHTWAPVQFLTLDQQSVTLQPGESVSIMLTLDATNILPGQFSDTITLTDTNDGSTRQIPVLLTVAGDQPPAAPGALAATRISPDRINLTWTDRSPNETGFRVERSLAPDGPFAPVATLAADSTSHSDTGVVSADTTRYYYRVFAFNDHGDSPFGTASAGNEPVAPVDVQAVIHPFYEIELSWAYTGPNTDRFFIERRLSPMGNWSVIAVVPFGDRSYRDPVGTFGSFDYRVTAFDSDLTGDPSAPLAIALEDTVFPPEAPASVGVTTVSANDLRINWEPPDTAGHQYIERGISENGPWTPLVYLPSSAASYTDTGLSPDTTYIYRVWASNAGGDSPRGSAQGTTNPAGDLMLNVPNTVDETAGHFIATLHRTGNNGDQVIRLIASNKRLSVPRYIIIPDGQSSVDVTVNVNDDDTVNSDDSTTLKAFAPAALVGESFSGDADTELAGQNTGWGWGGAWYHVNASPRLREPALHYTQNGTIGTQDSRFAGLAASDILGEGRRIFSEKLSQGSIWVSTLIYRQHNDFGVQMILRETFGGGDWARVRYSNEWLLESSGGNSVTLLNDNPAPDTLFLVMQFDFDARKIHAWLNPDVDTVAPSNWLGRATLDMREELSGISRLDIAGRSTTDGFDEIRVAAEFADLYGGKTATRAIRILDDEAPPLFPPSTSWRFNHFGTTTPEGDAAWEADPDGDGVPNILEYALGGDPLQPYTAPRALTGFIEIGNETYWTLRIDRNPDARDIKFHVQTSVDLLEWLGGPDHIKIMDDEPDSLRIRSMVPLSAETIRFLRFGVKLTHP